MAESNDIKAYDATERVTQFQSISAGLYWRSIQDIPQFAITEGMVLLIESIIAKQTPAIH